MARKRRQAAGSRLRAERRGSVFLTVEHGGNALHRRSESRGVLGGGRDLCQRSRRAWARSWFHHVKQSGWANHTDG